MNANFIKYISIALFVAIMGLFAWYIINNWYNFKSVLQIPLNYLFLLAVGGFIFIFFQALMFAIISKKLGVKLKAEEWFGATVVTFLTNYLIPFSGFGLRGAYLKIRHGMSVYNYTLLLLASVAVEFFIYASFALAGLIYIWSVGATVDWLIFGFMAVIVGGFLVSLKWPVSWIPDFLPLSGKLRSLLADWQGLSRDTSLMLSLMGTMIFQLLGFSLLFWLAFASLDLAVPLSYTVLSAALSDFSFLIRVTPVALGTFEAAIYYALRPLEMQIITAISVALIVRFSLMIIFLPLGPIFMFTTFKDVYRSEKTH